MISNYTPQRHRERKFWSEFYPGPGPNIDGRICWTRGDVDPFQTIDVKYRLKNEMGTSLEAFFFQNEGFMDMGWYHISGNNPVSSKWTLINYGAKDADNITLFNSALDWASDVGWLERLTEPIGMQDFLAMCNREPNPVHHYEVIGCYLPGNITGITGKPRRPKGKRIFQL